MYDVHIGVHRDTAETMASTLRSFTHVIAAFIDGDGWNVWGEAPGTDANDVDTLHLVGRCDTIGQAIDVAMSMADPEGPYREAITATNVAEVIGRPDPGEYVSGDLAVVSLTADWAEQQLAITTERVLLQGVEIPWE